jgi:hypothetical protein
VARVFYRVVKTNPPTLMDFMSNAAQGKPLLDTTFEKRRLWDGLSCFTTEAQARRNARRFRHQGSYIAELQLVDEDPIHFEKTRGPGHFHALG